METNRSKRSERRSKGRVKAFHRRRGYGGQVGSRKASNFAKASMGQGATRQAVFQSLFPLFPSVEMDCHVLWSLRSFAAKFGRRGTPPSEISRGSRLSPFSSEKGVK
jgi:hypothetical protein